MDKATEFQPLGKRDDYWIEPAYKTRAGKWTHFCRHCAIWIIFNYKGARALYRHICAPLPSSELGGGLWCIYFYLENVGSRTKQIFSESAHLAKIAGRPFPPMTTKEKNEMWK